MNMEKKLVKNATVVTSEKSFQGDVLISGGIITQIGENLCQDGAEVINAHGLVLIPGGVDAHTHMDLDVGFTRASDDFYTGTVAAACGGTTTIIDHMAFGPKGCELMHQPVVYEKLTEDAVIDFGLHGVIQHVNSEVLKDMQKLRNKGFTSVKIYSTYDYRLTASEAYEVLKRAKELDMVVCCHCEDHNTLTKLREEFIKESKTDSKYHPLSRPAVAEAQTVREFLRMSGEAGGTKVLVVHLTSQLGLKEIIDARTSGFDNIYAETCPQYLYLDDSLYDDPDEGLKYIMSPPLRKTTDQTALWEGLKDGYIDTVGTDHCPFFFATQKQRGREDFTQCPNGAPGVELRMPLMFTEAIKKDGKISLIQMVKTCCKHPADLFGLNGKKGDIAVGYDADLVLFDPARIWTATKSLLHENVDYTPYEGIKLTGAPIMTISRGEVIVDKGKFLGQKGRGRYLSR